MFQHWCSDSRSSQVLPVVVITWTNYRWRILKLRSTQLSLTASAWHSDCTNTNRVTFFETKGWNWGFREELISTMIHSGTANDDVHPMKSTAIKNNCMFKNYCQTQTFMLSPTPHHPAMKCISVHYFNNGDKVLGVLVVTGSYLSVGCEIIGNQRNCKTCTEPRLLLL